MAPKVSTMGTRAGRSAGHFALIGLLAGALAIGVAPIFVRLSEVGPSATAFWRLTLAMPAVWLWMALEGRGTRQPRRPSSRSDYRRLTVAGLFFATDLALWHWSIKYTSVSNATLLANLAPVFVALGSWLIFGRRMRPAFLLGMATALAGIGLLIGNSFRLDPQHFVGDLLGIITAVFYAGYILSVKELRAEFSSATILLFSGIVTSIALLPMALLAGEVLFPITLGGWATLLGLALLPQVGGQGLIAYALAHLPATFSSVSLLLQPVFATLLAWWLLGEALGPLQACGGALVLFGIFIARRENQAEQAA